mmetsp:Transcript_47259/g.143102  ORF Transcript_47259/g.143102 Transcript_47259/m.143102 type:complete len:228 (-) Transcript_47259:421-1104(-)
MRSRLRTLALVTRVSCLDMPPMRLSRSCLSLTSSPPPWAPSSLRCARTAPATGSVLMARPRSPANTSSRTVYPPLHVFTPSSSPLSTLRRSLTSRSPLTSWSTSSSLSSPLSTLMTRPSTTLTPLAASSLVDRMVTLGLLDVRSSLTPTVAGVPTVVELSLERTPPRWTVPLLTLPVGVLSPSLRLACANGPSSSSPMPLVFHTLYPSLLTLTGLLRMVSLMLTSPM